MKHEPKTEEDWLELRKKYITASQGAILVGANPYSSPKAIREPKPFFGNAFTEVGHALEPVVVYVTNKVLGTEFKLYEDTEGCKAFYTSGKLGATPDAHEDHKVLLECKTTRPKTYIKYSSVPPSTYLIQLMVQMMCTDIDVGYLAIMSTDLTQPTPELKWPITIYKVERSEAICDILNEEAERFGPKFRVDSKVKKRVKLLLSMAWEKV